MALRCQLGGELLCLAPDLQRLGSDGSDSCRRDGTEEPAQQLARAQGREQGPMSVPTSYLKTCSASRQLHQLRASTINYLVCLKFILQQLRRIYIHFPLLPRVRRESFSAQQRQHPRHRFPWVFGDQVVFALHPGRLPDLPHSAFTPHSDTFHRRCEIKILQPQPSTEAH